MDVYGFKNLKNINLDELIEKFMNDFDHDRPLEWFDKEVLSITGTDILTLPFNKKAGFSIFKTENFDFLILRMEDLNQSGEDALRIFTGNRSLKLIRANIGEEKEYSKIYKEFKEKIDIGEDYVNKMYASRYSQAFYSDADLSDLKSRWLNLDSNA